MWAEYMSALMKQLTAAQSSASPEAAGRAETRISELLQEVRSQSIAQSCPPSRLSMGQPLLSAPLQVLVLLMRYALGDLHKMKQFVVGKASQVSPVNLHTPSLREANQPP